MAGIGQTVGYRRVSTVDQNVDRQLEGLTLDETFEDYASGKNTQRPQLEAMLKHVRRGDKIVCHSMDRFARNLDDLRRLVMGLTDRGVQVQFLKENLTFTGGDSPMANLLLSVMGAFAQFEREILKERQREGVALAKKRGVYRGRKPSLSTQQIGELLERVKNGERKASIARHFDVSRETVYCYLRTAEQSKAA